MSNLVIIMKNKITLNFLTLAFWSLHTFPFKISIYKKGDLPKDIVFVADSLNNKQPRDGSNLDRIKCVKIIFSDD